MDIYISSFNTRYVC